MSITTQSDGLVNSDVEDSSIERDNLANQPCKNDLTKTSDSIYLYRGNQKLFKRPATKSGPYSHGQLLRRQKHLAARRTVDRDRCSASYGRLTSLTSRLSGECHDMCPEHERVERLLQKDIWPEEMTARKHADGSIKLVADETRMVKKYRRPAAGSEEQLPSDLRSPQALQFTVEFLIHDVLQNANSLASVHHFIWDRTRALRSDFTILNMTHPDNLELSINVFERICRFHILSLHQLADSPKPYERYDWYQEREQLSKTLISLLQYYDDSRHLLLSKNEPEFRAYSIVLQIQNPIPDLEDRIQTWPSHILQHSKVQSALELYNSALTTDDRQGPLQPRVPHLMGQGNFARFWKILRSPQTSYLLACAAELYFNVIRRSTLEFILRSYRPGSANRYDWSLKDLVSVLGFDTLDETFDFCRAHGFSFKSTTTSSNSQSYLDLSSISSKVLPTPSSQKIRNQYKSFSIVEAKRHSRSFAAVIDGLSVKAARQYDMLDQSQSLFKSDCVIPPQISPPTRTTKPESNSHFTCQANQSTHIFSSVSDLSKENHSLHTDSHSQSLPMAQTSLPSCHESDPPSISAGPNAIGGFGNPSFSSFSTPCFSTPCGSIPPSVSTPNCLPAPPLPSTSLAPPSLNFAPISSISTSTFFSKASPNSQFTVRPSLFTNYPKTDSASQSVSTFALASTLGNVNAQISEPSSLSTLSSTPVLVSDPINEASTPSRISVVDTTASLSSLSPAQFEKNLCRTRILTEAARRQDKITRKKIRNFHQTQDCLDRLSSALLLDPCNGLLKQYIEYCIGPIIANCITLVEQNLDLEQAKWFRHRSLMIKYSRLWRKLALTSRLKRQGREHRKRLADLHESILRSSRVTSMEHQFHEFRQNCRQRSLARQILLQKSTSDQSSPSPDVFDLESFLRYSSTLDTTCQLQSPPSTVLPSPPSDNPVESDSLHEATPDNFTRRISPTNPLMTSGDICNPSSSSRIPSNSRSHGSTVARKAPVRSSYFMLKALGYKTSRPNSFIAPCPATSSNRQHTPKIQVPGKSPTSPPTNVHLQLRKRNWSEAIGRTSLARLMENSNPPSGNS